MFVIGCQKEPEFKTESNVRIHEIEVSSDSSVVYWYIFFKDGKFIYTNSPYKMSDFSGTFFLSSKEIPNELKFSEEFIRKTETDSVDNWGIEVLELQEDSSNINSSGDSVLDEVLKNVLIYDSIDSVVQDSLENFGDSL